jgi:predicted porin
MGVSVEYPLTQHVIIRGIGELSGRRGSFSERTNISMADAVADFNGLAIPSQYSHILVKESIYRSQLYYGALGVGVGIPLRKHTIRADVAYHHLMGTKSKRVQEVTNGTEFNAKAVQTITSFKEGVNPHDIVFSIGYQFAFSKRAAVEIQGHYGLLDMSKNSFYESFSKHHSLQMRTGIRYRFY